MGFQILTTATAPLSLSDAKAHLRVLHDADDVSIQGMVNAAWSDIEGRVGRAYREMTGVLELPEFPDGPIYLPRPPLVSVQSLTYVDSAGDAQTYTDFRLDTRSVPGSIHPEIGQTWPATQTRHDAVSVAFTTGAVTVPDDLTFAAMLWLEVEYHETKDDRARRIEKRINDLCCGHKVRSTHLKGIRP